MKTMEPILLGEEEGANDGDDNLSSSRRRFGKFTDTDLDKLQLGLSEIEKLISTFSGAFGGEGADSTNFPESFLANQSNINNANINPQLPPPQTNSQVTTSQILLADFDEFETTMLPPTPTFSLGVTTANHSSISTTSTTPAPYQQHTLAGELEESLVMIEEMADHEHDDQFVLGSCNDPTENVFVLGNCNDPTENVDIDIGFSNSYACHSDVAGGGIGPFSEQAYNYGHGIRNCNGLGIEVDCIRGGPSITFSAGPSSSVRYFICSQSSDGVRTEMVKSRRNKRRYKGVIETEEETARRLERTKIKNREAAAKAHERKQAYEAYLQTQILKLRKKNKFLKNMVMFLQGHKRVDVHPQPLRRTISGTK